MFYNTLMLVLPVLTVGSFVHITKSLIGNLKCWNVNYKDATETIMGTLYSTVIVDKYTPLDSST